MKTNNPLENIDLSLAKLNQALRIEPYNPELYNNLACVYYRINKLADAIYNYKKSLYLNPNNWQAHYNLANCYVKQNIILEAISHYQAAITLNPDHIETIQNLGVLLVDTNNFIEALPYLEKSYSADHANQSNAEFVEQLANCHLQLGNIPQAIDYLNKVININPSKESAHHNLAILYLREKNHELAAKHFAIVLQLNNNNQTAKHMIAAINQQNISQPPIEYVTDLFDQYAAYYNKHTKEALQYCLPEKFRSLYTKHNTIATAKNTLDLGCGTGQCGLYFRDATINLLGVDISKNMLLHAKQSGFYDLLIRADLQQGLPFTSNYFDLIIAADVMPYIGNLVNIFSEIKNILSVKSKSNFLFNIELTGTKEQDDDFLLQKTGRYTHSSNYIVLLAKKFGFTIIENTNETIRLQDGKAVMGMIFLIVNTYL